MLVHNSGKKPLLAVAISLTVVKVIPGCIWTNAISHMHLKKESECIYRVIISIIICAS